MDKTTETIVWTLYDEEGYWRYSFGMKNGTMVTSSKFMTKERAIKSFEDEVAKIKTKRGDSVTIVIEKI